MSVEIGDKAPDFTLPTDGNGSVTLSKLRGKKVVLYFYPKDDTSGCTAEACGFRDALPELRQDRRHGDRHLARTRSPRTTSSRRSTSCRSSSPPTARARCPRPTASGSRRACTAANTWASSAHLPDRRGGRRARRLAQGQGAGPCRRGAEGGAGALTAPARTPSPTAPPRSLRAAEPAAEGRAQPRRWRRAGGRGALVAIGAAAPPPIARPGRSARCCCRRATCRSGAPLRLGGRAHRAAPRAGAYRAERDRSRLGHHRALRRR